MADCGSKPQGPSRTRSPELARRGFLASAVAVGAAASFPAGRAAILANGTAVLSPDEADTLAALADALVPGASQAGVVAFIQQTLADPAPMHCYRFLGIPEGPVEFYKAALAALERFSVRARARSFTTLDAPARTGIIEALLAGTRAWDGPPFGAVYFAIRNDALDAVYGTPTAYDRLGLPYMPHILPTKPW